MVNLDERVNRIFLEEYAKAYNQVIRSWPSDYLDYLPDWISLTKELDQAIRERGAFLMPRQEYSRNIGGTELYEKNFLPPLTIAIYNLILKELENSENLSTSSTMTTIDKKTLAARIVIGMMNSSLERVASNIESLGRVKFPTRRRLRYFVSNYLFRCLRKAYERTNQRLGRFPTTTKMINREDYPSFSYPFTPEDGGDLSGIPMRQINEFFRYLGAGTEGVSYEGTSFDGWSVPWVVNLITIPSALAGLDPNDPDLLSVLTSASSRKIYSYNFHKGL